MMAACSNQPSGSELPMCREYSQSDNPIVITVGEQFALKLVSNPTTGYGWQSGRALDGNVLALVTNTYIPERTDRRVAGSGGHEIWTFRAVARGEAEIVMQYVRAWEKDIPPIQTNCFRVSVK